MNHLEDDMDELFNKAGRHYPLKTESSDWDSVKAALDNEAAGVTSKPNTSYRRFFPLLLLLLIPAVYVFVDKDNVKVADATGKVISQQAVPGKEVQKNNSHIISSEVTNHNAGETKTTHPSSIKDLPSLKRPSINPAPGNKLPNKIEENRSLNLSLKKKPPQYFHQPSTADRPLSPGRPVNQRADENITGDAKAWTSFPSLLTGYTFNNPSANINMEDQEKTFVPQNSSSSVPNFNKKKNNIKGLYYGITASPDLSTIKGQSIKGVGYSAGLVLGYKISGRFAIESGALWSRKKYYTDGKYFDKTKPGIPDYINIDWLNGGCSMFEIPLVVRYNIKAKKNTFFVSTGLTSYLMKNEDYTYSATAGAGGYPYEGKRSYDRSGDHLFANVQLSAGYNFSVSPKMNFRIEPYLKAPLKKIGIGRMPITSTGLYLSLTRDFR